MISGSASAEAHENAFESVDLTGSSTGTGAAHGAVSADTSNLSTFDTTFAEVQTTVDAAIDVATSGGGVMSGTGAVLSINLVRGHRTPGITDFDTSVDALVIVNVSADSV